MRVSSASWKVQLAWWGKVAFCEMRSTLNHHLVELVPSFCMETWPKTETGKTAVLYWNLNTEMLENVMQNQAEISTTAF